MRQALYPDACRAIPVCVGITLHAGCASAWRSAVAFIDAQGDHTEQVLKMVGGVHATKKDERGWLPTRLSGRLACVNCSSELPTDGPDANDPDSTQRALDHRAGYVGSRIEGLRFLLGPASPPTAIGWSPPHACRAPLRPISCSVQLGRRN